MASAPTSALDRHPRLRLPTAGKGFIYSFNARGKPHRSAQRVGNQQAKLVGVGLTNQLGRCAKARG